jgi:hypothetical protein
MAVIRTGCLAVTGVLVRVVMNFDAMFPFLSGYEHLGDRTRLYVDGPKPTPRFDRVRGVRTPLFRLLAGEDAQAVRVWLASNRAWQCLRVPPAFCRERGIRAVLIADDWHSGDGTALNQLARTRRVAGLAHRERLQREVRWLIGSVLENPVRDGEFEELQLLEEVIHTAPLGVELATSGELVDTFFGARR